jgi:hypothetical protein
VLMLCRPDKGVFCLSTRYLYPKQVALCSVEVPCLVICYACCYPPFSARVKLRVTPLVGARRPLVCGRCIG